jgi:prepilin peptidase CpaA
LDGHFVSALFSGAMVFAATWYCWKRGWIGGGDVKLLTACALLVPPASVPELILSTAIAGGVLALVYMALARLPSAGASKVIRSRSATLVKRVWRAERRRIRRGLSLPYACAIGAGVALTLCSPVPFG